MGRVELEHVRKEFDGVVAVDDLSLEIADEELLVLVGPSGCGKSTALRMIAGLDEPTAGVIRIGDRVVNDVEAKDRDVAMVFQSYALYPHMTVRRNIEFPLRSRGLPAPERARLVAEAAEALALTDLLERKPAKLSGGQRQRVALARAIVRRPQVFLMDEPLSNLDAKLRMRTRTELVELQQRLAATVLYVTHDQVEALTMGHRIAVLDGGVLQQVGAPAEVYDRPANLFVARFIGSPPMNTLPGVIGVSGADLVVDVAGTAVLLSPAAGRTVTAAGVREVVVGLRPEALELIDAVHADGGTLPATVSVVESLGHERLVVCRLANSELVVVRQDPRSPGPGIGSVVHLVPDRDAVHLFHPDSGERLQP